MSLQDTKIRVLLDGPPAPPSPVPEANEQDEDTLARGGSGAVASNADGFASALTGTSAGEHSSCRYLPTCLAHIAGVSGSSGREFASSPELLHTQWPVQWLLMLQGSKELAADTQPASALAGCGSLQ